VLGRRFVGALVGLRGGRERVGQGAAPPGEGREGGVGSRDGGVVGGSCGPAGVGEPVRRDGVVGAGEFAPYPVGQFAQVGRGPSQRERGHLEVHDRRS